MAPGSSVFKEVLESHLMSSDYETGKAKSEAKSNSTSTKSSIGLNGKNGVSSNNGVYELLGCSVCKNLMYPPIHQISNTPLLLLDLFIEGYMHLILVYCSAYSTEKMCPNGHTLCCHCKVEVHNICPSCHHELGNIRCLALEKVAESLELPCRYQSLGCHDIFPYYTKLKHEQNCGFRPYNCPYAGSECSVMGDIPTLVAHLKDDHKVDMHDGCTFNHRYVKANPHEVENATWMLTVFNSFGRHFCLHFEAFQLGSAPVYMAFLRFMGDDYEAKKFSYSLEVGANGRKLIWQGIPRSIRDSHRKVRDSQDGLIIQRNLALYFSGGERQELKLRISGRIWRED
ncbi:E3 ubiquitin-protein [Vigna angularis]|uniref:RING-type E3 ubiquitin transferase n=1 Tax=Phaseolus angularis TaxID=3914 RepID=A0A8T0L1R8_PHAAN|nr:E3 ubiquitin-protein [Vigna angularis]